MWAAVLCLKSNIICILCAHMLRGKVESSEEHFHAHFSEH